MPLFAMSEEFYILVLTQLFNLATAVCSLVLASLGYKRVNGWKKVKRKPRQRRSPAAASRKRKQEGAGRLPPTRPAE